MQRHVQTVAGRELKDELLRFITDESAPRAANERLPGSSEVLESSLGKLKSFEGDFAKSGFIPNAGWVFIVDQLNIHCCEELVRYVANLEGIPQSLLGRKDRSGTLKCTCIKRCVGGFRNRQNFKTTLFSTAVDSAYTQNSPKLTIITLKKRGRWPVSYTHLTLPTSDLV